MDDMKDLGSCELRPLDAMKSLRLWTIWKILGREPMDLNAMNRLGF